jgi:diguanylate cyclase (GGDEF)-like protein
VSVDTAVAFNRGYARFQREADLQHQPGKITLGTTIALPVVAVGVVLGGVSPTAAPFVERTAEFVAIFSLLLGWRFRRSRLVLAAGTLALANFLIRTSLSAEITAGFGPSLAALSVLLPLDLGLIGVLSEGKVLRWRTLVLALGIAAQPFLVSRVLTLAQGGSDFGLWYLVMTTPQASHLAFLITTALTLVAFTIRRGIFEIGLFGVLGACALGLFVWPGVFETTTFFAAAQLVLLFGLFEDSYRLAFVDALTGLPGRRALDDALHGLGGDYTLAMIDIDYFKKFNDRWGHEAGDQALRMVAQCLRMTGGKAQVFRYGGEEFAAVFPTLTVTKAREHLEDVRALIAKRSFNIRSPHRPGKKPNRPNAPKKKPPQARLTVSIGAAGPSGRQPDSDDVLRAADRALYRAKRAGRNRLVTG